MPRIDERLAWAEAKLRECRALALRYFNRTSLRIEHKADHSPVTIADRAIEERLRRELAKAFPGEAIVGEEFGGSATRTGTYWTLDPIDGTRAFSRGLPSWGMMIGRVEQGRAMLGACDYPVFETFIGTAPRSPAYERRDGRRILLRRTDAPATLSHAVLFHGGSQWWFPTKYAEGFRRLVSGCYLERAYGDCYAYLWVLRGKGDAVLDYGVKIWDMVPFAALAQATGRVLTDFSGRSNFTGPETIFGHPALVRIMTRLLRQD